MDAKAVSEITIAVISSAPSQCGEQRENQKKRSGLEEPSFLRATPLLPVRRPSLKPPEEVVGLSNTALG